MPVAPTKDVAADFFNVPSENRQTISDPLGDATKPVGLPDAWDLGDITFAYDRLTKDLWVGVEYGSSDGSAVDFATPGGAAANAANGDQPNLGFGEFLTGAIDLDNDGGFDLWFGFATNSASGFMTALYTGDTAGDGSTSNDYAGGEFGIDPTAPLGIGNSWLSATPDTVGGETAFEFKLDLDANSTLAALLPDPNSEETIFRLAFDTGSALDTYGEDDTEGTITFGKIPEPSSMSLLALGLLGCIRRKR